MRKECKEQIDAKQIEDLEDLEQVKEPKLEPLSLEKEELLFKKIDLTGTNEWSSEDQEKVKELFREYGQLFALDDLDLGHTSIVKHKIELDNYRPFKDRYRRIPPHQYEEVRKHLNDMLKIGAIQKSNSPWVSAVVLVRKKDGSLRFCIDLRKLNSRTIKDAYGLPRIEETLDCLGGVYHIHFIGSQEWVLASGDG